jgi:hypothetical protein
MNDERKRFTVHHSAFVFLCASVADLGWDLISHRLPVGGIHSGNIIDTTFICFFIRPERTWLVNAGFGLRDDRR